MDLPWELSPLTLGREEISEHIAWDIVNSYEQLFVEVLQLCRWGSNGNSGWRRRIMSYTYLAQVLKKGVQGHITSMADSLQVRQCISLPLLLDSLGRNQQAIQGYLTFLAPFVPLALFAENISPLFSTDIPPESPVCKLSLVLVLSVTVLTPSSPGLEQYSRCNETVLLLHMYHQIFQR